MAGFERGPERVLIETDFLTMVEGSFTMPDGEVVTRQIVRHPGAVVVVPLDGDDVVFVRQYRAAIDRELVEIPAGKRDVADEAPEVTAERELIEEIGMRPGRLELLTRFVNTPGFCDEETWLYLATDLEPVDRGPQTAEEAHMSIERMPFDDAVAAATSGVIDDAKTIIGLLLAARRR